MLPEITDKEHAYHLKATKGGRCHVTLKFVKNDKDCYTEIVFWTLDAGHHVMRRQGVAMSIIEYNDQKVYELGEFRRNNTVRVDIGESFTTEDKIDSCRMKIHDARMLWHELARVGFSEIWRNA